MAQREKTNFRPISYSSPFRQASTTSSRSVSTSARSEGSFSNSYAEALDLVEQLSKNLNLPATDPVTAGKLDRFRNLYSILCDSEQRKINEYLKRNECSELNQVLPGTVGSYLCGCFLRSSAYAGQPVGCAVGCASNPISSPDQKPCSETVILWTRDASGAPTQHIIQRGNGNCRINVDPNFPNLTPQQRADFLSKAGCKNATMYNALTNAPLGEINNARQTTGPAPVSQVYSQPATTLPNPNPTPANGGGGGFLWWILALLFIFILIGIIIFVWTRE